jgi:pimeloyl-ACP methyl ester carboxylesterase
MKSYVYLHGFASSPQSMKAQYLSDRFRAVRQPLALPDLNQSDFYHLTLTRQIQQVQALLPAEPIPVTLIGSSFGGLTAAWVGEQCQQVDRLVLLAPAFQFLTHWLPKLGAEKMQRWQMERSLSVYHYGKRQMLPLSYTFVTDLAQYQDQQLQRPVPTLILHGRADEVIPIQASRNYAAQRPWVNLIELESDHALGAAQAEIWAAIQTFCGMTTETS